MLPERRRYMIADHARQRAEERIGHLTEGQWMAILEAVQSNLHVTKALSGSRFRHEIPVLFGESETAVLPIIASKNGYIITVLDPEAEYNCTSFEVMDTIRRPLPTRPFNGNSEDLTGRVSGSMTVIGLSATKKGRWVTRCECGAFNLFTARALTATVFGGHCCGCNANRRSKESIL